MTKDTDIIAKEGYVIILIAALIAVGLFFLHPLAGIAGVLLCLFCVYFFRNPRRVCSQEPGKLISPADGKVIFIGEAEESHFLNKKMYRVTIFMSPISVHVNRSPASGEVLNTKYQPGKFLAAFKEEASKWNEQSAVHLKTDEGDDIVFVQIAGWLARRIINYAKLKEHLLRGSIFGVIRFGSRMDVYFPETYSPCIHVNQMIKAGETVIASK